MNGGGIGGSSRALAAAAGIALALAALPAAAHQPSDAYLDWRVDGAVVEQRVDIALRDLDRALDLDADGDGVLRWGEVRMRWDAIERVARDGVVVRADGADCRAHSVGTPQLDTHADGTHAVLRSTWQCPAPVRRLTVDYRLFAVDDATHRGIARVAFAGHDPRPAVLVPGAGVQTFVGGGGGGSGASDAGTGTGTGTGVAGATVDGSAQGARAAAAVDPSTRTAAGSHAGGFASFVAEGLRHIAGGLDHVLFLVTLLVVAVWRRDGAAWAPQPSLRAAGLETLRWVTAFTLAHSLTLGLAVAGVVAPPARWIESLIALSVLVAALDNLWPLVRAPRWAMVSVFGLAHGFGFAGPMQQLGLPPGGLVVPLLGFNVGVEIGQLAVVALLLPLAFAARRTAWYRRGVVQAGSAAVALLALAWTLERALDWRLLS